MSAIGRKYVVLHESYDNETQVGNFILAIGVYSDAETAYGAAYLELSEFVDNEADETPVISAPYRLEGDTGYGLSIKHESYTDRCLVLIINEEEGEE